MARGPKFYLWQPVIAYPIILQKMEEPQTAVSPWLGLISHELVRHADEPQ